MTKGLIGKKLGMTQLFSDEGVSVPVTVIEVAPSVVIQKKTAKTDGYDALQLGYGRIKQRNVTKALQGHFKKADKGLFRVLREFNMDPDGCEAGQELNAEMFAPGDYVDVVGTTKGKGFAGVIKRHGFRGGRATHGSMFHRAPGSIGASADPSRVFKGTKLPGHMGSARKTVQNLLVWAVRPEMNVILVRGAVPGCKNGYVLIKQAIKKGQ
ncbi:MAG: 50S ribosomal protein L3 [Syntrophobacterales bacterium CG03_land_8_20_14_0_80_58_14]|nr:MAG: 50S ribosomal protein L3 [Syntrophaceae bacterium CG2_30_58_14]PIV02938.1 MAG: 50S ribosomal protein L3 [Syntrophobacterales bacterium CG03_land_8_20_14_0_80_58_14]